MESGDSKIKQSKGKSGKNVKKAGTSMVSQPEELIIPELEEYTEDSQVRVPDWASEEDEIIRKYYTRAPAEAIAQVLSEKFRFPRTRSAVEKRASRLKISKILKQALK